MYAVGRILPREVEQPYNSVLAAGGEPVAVLGYVEGERLARAGLELDLRSCDVRDAEIPELRRQRSLPVRSQRPSGVIINGQMRSPAFPSGGDAPMPSARDAPQANRTAVTAGHQPVAVVAGVDEHSSVVALRERARLTKWTTGHVPDEGGPVLTSDQEPTAVAAEHHAGDVIVAARQRLRGRAAMSSRPQIPEFGGVVIAAWWRATVRLGDDAAAATSNGRAAAAASRRARLATDPRATHRRRRRWRPSDCRR